MSKLGDKIGEMFMAGFMGTDPMAAGDLIRRYHVGGIILFSRNIKDVDQVRSVCEKLQELRREVSDSPLFIAIDQEGGCVARITEGVTVFPGNMALGAAGSESLARQAGNTTGLELSNLGINVNFAPVLDINSNPRNPGIGARSFGSNPALVARLGSAMIRGMQEKGLFATAKHFPGLGEAHVDSHDALPVVDVKRERLEERELSPFRAAIDSEVAFIMTAHCSYPALDDTLAPATLSRPILTNLLREHMGFRGIVITDCLEMAAIEKDLSPAQSALMAVRAGADMLLICHTLRKQVEAIDSLTRSVEAGEISEETIDSAVAAISSFKGRLPLCGTSFNGIVPERTLSEAIAAQAVTIVRNEGSIIPLKLRPEDKLALIVPAFELLTQVEESAGPEGEFLDEIRLHHRNLLYRKISVKPEPAETGECLKICRDADIIVLLTYNMHLYPSQKALVQGLLELDKPAIVVAVRDPYDLAFAPGARACIATYGFRDCSLKALAGVLFGKYEARGRLPIALEETVA